MGRLRFFFSPRWILFFLAIVIVSGATWWLGEWQFGRLDERKESNSIVRANEQGTPSPVDTVMAPDKPVAKTDQWRLVTATGTYDADNTLVWRYRSNERTDQAGIDVVVPLITADGTALFVDRGFVANGGNDALTKIPDPPSGTVTVTGYVRANGTGDSTKVYGGLNTRALSSKTAAQATGLTAYEGWLQLKAEDPAPADAPEPLGLPDLSNGPHFFYGIQWWFFGLLAIVGFGYLLWDEYRMERAEQGAASGDGPEPDAERDDDPDTARSTGTTGTPAEGAVTTRDKSAKEIARDAKLSKKKALKAAYQAAYDKEEAR